MSWYVIDCWDDVAGRWVGCFNGMEIGPEFVAPIVARTTTKVRLRVLRTSQGPAAIRAFEAYFDATPSRALNASGK